MIHAIFFDFNGVIIDDERIHLRAYREVLASHGVGLTDEDYFPCLGMDDVAFTRAAFARAGRQVDEQTTRAIIDREGGKAQRCLDVSSDDRADTGPCRRSVCYGASGSSALRGGRLELEQDRSCRAG